ncbi:hypothetical protein OIU74_006855, partial [Salix koriyanagi]
MTITSAKSNNKTSLVAIIRENTLTRFEMMFSY